MLAKIWSMALVGVEGVLIEIEIDVSKKLPRFDIVGLPDPAIREAKYRVRTAIKNSGYDFPYARILINLAPANIKKQGPRYDLPIALALLIASGQVDKLPLQDTIVIGELALDGTIRPVPGILSIALAAFSSKKKQIICSEANAQEAAAANVVDVYSLRSLRDIPSLFTQKVDIANNKITTTKNNHNTVDFKEVLGQESVKRSVLIAAAGKHHCLLSGSPGCGKSMIAKRFPTILPKLEHTESIESTQIYSVTNLLGESALVTVPPFRAPHHTISNVALVGGGSFPQPGEISLAHNGVLFLDELPEFPRKTLDMLRQPLEDHMVTISRAQQKVSFPCNFLLVAAMNPCPCGYYTDEKKECRCLPYMVERYQKRISGPLLDRFDLHIHVRRVQHESLISTTASMSSQEMKSIVEDAREIQKKRLKKYQLSTNSQMTLALIKNFCVLSETGAKLMQKAMQSMELSARSYQKILKVSRTIADIDKSEKIAQQHIAEALQYRYCDARLSI